MPGQRAPVIDRSCSASISIEARRNSKLKDRIAQRYEEAFDTRHMWRQGG